MEREELRDDLNQALKRIAGMQGQRELALCRTKVEEALHWLQAHIDMEDRING